VFYQSQSDSYLSTFKDADLQLAFKTCKGVREMERSQDIIEKCVSQIFNWYKPNMLPYTELCLYYRDGYWYKYNGLNPTQIITANATPITDQELHKLIKKKLLSNQKKQIINTFLQEELKLESLNIQKTHFTNIQNLAIDNQLYVNIKMLLEYVFTFNEKIYV
jgi:hypothetical protein